MRWRSERSRGLLAPYALACLVAASVTTSCGEGRGAGAAADAPSAPARRAAAPVTATLLVAVGDVRAREAAAAAWAPAHAGLPLHPLDAVQTMSAARAAVRFAEDGTVAELSPGTTLEIPEQRRAEVRMRHVAGRMVARLPANAEPGRRVELDLPPGTLVLEASPAVGGAAQSGVEARVDVSPQGTEIAMLEGRGRLASRGGRSVTIEQSRYLRIDRDGAIVGGALLAAVTLAEPRADETVRTRSTVTFSWREASGATSYRLRAVGDDGTVVETTAAAPALQASLSLESQHYVWTVEPVADGGATGEPERRSLTVVLDRTPPSLVIESPTAGASTREPEVAVRGRTEPSARIDVEGRAVQVRGDGTFEARVAIPRGLANLVIRATDPLGNTRATSRTVVRE